MSAEVATRLHTSTAEGARGGKRTNKRSGNRGSNRNTRPNGHRTGKGDQAAGDDPQEPTSVGKPAEDQAVVEKLGAVAVSEAGDMDVCWICAEPVKYYSVSECNHRTCHVCAIRLRALYKKMECTFCKVCSALSLQMNSYSPLGTRNPKTRSYLPVLLTLRIPLIPRKWFPSKIQNFLSLSRRRT